MAGNSLVGKLMTTYRRSKFHNAKNGKLLASVLAKYVSLLPQKEIVKKIGDWKYHLDLTQVIDSSLFFTGSFEPNVELLLDQFLTPGMTAIDIGANIGYHTLRMAHHTQPGGLVYAIEPSPWAFQRLMRNLALNPSIDNVKACQIGLSEKELGNVSESFVSSYSLSDHSDQLDSTLVRMTSLDEFVISEHINKVHFIKMDVDGYEGKIITGGKQILKRDHPTIIFEITPSKLMKTGYDPFALLSCLTEFGYLLYTDDLLPIKKFAGFIENHQEDDSSMIFAKTGSLDNTNC
ncbi:MAG: FkbM family methyltransferase [Anaerolineaceae bacterium]